MYDRVASDHSFLQDAVDPQKDRVQRHLGFTLT